jgi:hypothetical protein
MKGPLRNRIVNVVESLTVDCLRNKRGKQS